MGQAIHLGDLAVDIGRWYESEQGQPINSPPHQSDSTPDRTAQRRPSVIMELTADMFRRIVESPQAEADLPVRTGREQRKARRTSLTAQAALMPFSDRFALEPIVAPVRDVSRGGFGFLHDQQVPLGEQFAMVLPESSGKPIVILCTVTYYQPLAEDLFAIGARFCRVLSEGAAGLPLVFEDAISGELSETRLAS